MTKIDLFRIHTASDQHTRSTTQDHVNLSLSSPNYDGHPAGDPLPSLNQRPWGSSVAGSAGYVLPPVRWC